MSSLYKKKMKEESDRNFLVDSYRTNREFANEIKSNWKRQVDPILQRGDQYIPKEKPVQLCKLNYFERMKQKENKAKPKSIHNHYGNVYKESDPPKQRNHKRLYTPDITKRNREINNGRIRIFPEQYTRTKIGALINEEKTPPESERYHVRIEKHYYKPSEEYVKMNNKFNLLPSERRSLYMDKDMARSYNSFRNNVGGKYNREGLDNTKNRLFNTNIEEGDNKGKIRLVGKIAKKERRDNVNSLISYQYAPKFREEKYTEKPNNSNYTTVVSKTIENISENFVPA